MANQKNPLTEIVRNGIELTIVSAAGAAQRKLDDQLERTGHNMPVAAQIRNNFMQGIEAGVASLYAAQEQLPAETVEEVKDYIEEETTRCLFDGNNDKAVKWLIRLMKRLSQEPPASSPVASPAPVEPASAPVAPQGERRPITVEIIREAINDAGSPLDVAQRFVTRIIGHKDIRDNVRSALLEEVEAQVASHMLQTENARDRADASEAAYEWMGNAMRHAQGRRPLERSRPTQTVDAAPPQDPDRLKRMARHQRRKGRRGERDRHDRSAA